MVPQSEAESDLAVETGTPEKKSFLGSTNARILLAAVALFALLVVAGVAVFVFLVQMPTMEESSVDAVTVNQPAEQESVQQPVEPSSQALSDTFIFRNIFKPSVKAPAPPKDTTSDTTDSGDEATDQTAGVDELLLVSIGSSDGERTATFLWNGERYVLGSGDTIPNTPWKVVDISSDSVSVIYGDSSPIVLSVGASISK